MLMEFKPEKRCIHILVKHTKTSTYLFFLSSPGGIKFLHPFHSRPAFQSLSMCGDKMVQKSSKLMSSCVVSPCCWHIDSTRFSISCLLRLLFAISSSELATEINQIKINQYYFLKKAQAKTSKLNLRQALYVLLETNTRICTIHHEQY